MGAGNAVPVLVLRQGGKGVKLGLSAVAWACGGCLGISGFLSPCLPLSVVPVDQGGAGAGWRCLATCGAVGCGR